MVFSPSDSLSRRVAVLPHALLVASQAVNAVDNTHLLRHLKQPLATHSDADTTAQRRQPNTTMATTKTTSMAMTATHHHHHHHHRRTTKRLSTERSRRCRQRQKRYAEALESDVRGLQAFVANLEALRALRQERALLSPASTFANIVREYCSVFERGMAVDATTGPLSAPQQRAFLQLVMHPDVVVFDWLGRSRVGTATLLNGWTAWSTWHESLRFELQSLEVLEADDDMVAITTRGVLRVVVSDSTFRHLFPHLAGDDAMRDKLLGSEIAYPFRDVFYFSSHGRVRQYSVDMDIVTALALVIGDMTRVADVVSPPNGASLNDLAVKTEGVQVLQELEQEEGQEEEEEQQQQQQQEPDVTPPPHRPDKRLEMAYILS
ncbi:hypothetical protein PINS_up005977 [Pythium insidiosum]|nr:hypothetical protein PINS_up005977 [Pythium insidiosum]